MSPTLTRRIPRGVVLLGLLAVACSGAGDRGHAERTAREHRGDPPLATPEAVAEPAVPVHGEPVVYAEVDGRPVAGYLARPRAGAADLPGLIVIHEWWGLNDYIRAMTRRLAGEGYLALAVDLYDGQQASEPEAARALLEASLERAGRLEENLRQAAAWLESRGVQRTGVIGWSFGGGWALNTALAMPQQIDATVVYYGRVETRSARLAALNGSLLGIFAENDRGIPLETVRAFERALDEAGRDARIHVFEGVGHAFADPSGAGYRAEAAEDAWRLTVGFLGESLR